MTKELALSDLNRLQNLASRIGGQTAGQVVDKLLEQIAIGFDISMYGVLRVQKEVLPVYQVCHKGENESPTIDWNKWLFIPQPIIEEKPPVNTLVAHIKH